MRLSLASLLAAAAIASTAHAWPAYDDTAPRPVHDDIMLAQLDASAGVAQVNQVASGAAYAALSPGDPMAQATAAFEAAQARNWPALVVALCSVIAFALRRFTPAAHFFHTAAWMWIATVGSAVLDAGAQAIAQHGFSWVPIAVGVLGAVTTLLAQSKPVAQQAPALATVKS